MSVAIAGNQIRCTDARPLLRQCSRGALLPLGIARRRDHCARHSSITRATSAAMEKREWNLASPTKRLISSGQPSAEAKKGRDEQGGVGRTPNSTQTGWAGWLSAEPNRTFRGTGRGKRGGRVVLLCYVRGSPSPECTHALLRGRLSPPFFPRRRSTLAFMLLHG